MKMTENLRTWLIAALTHQKLPALAEQQFDKHFDTLSVPIVEMASDEGVLVLLEYQLSKHPDLAKIPAVLLTQIQSAAKQDLLQQLPFHAEQKKLFQALNQAQIPFLVMKGAALGNWLYDSPNHRPVTDIDLWFKDQHTVNSLAEILQPLGFIAVQSSGNLTSFEQAFDKDFNGIRIRLDAHWAMFNSAILSAGMSYETAYSRAMLVTIQGQDVRALCITDALINSIGHRALKFLTGQADTLKWLYDQHLLLKALNVEQWQELVMQSAEIGISDLTLDAIEQAQKNFNIQVPSSLLSALLNNAKQEKINRLWFQSWPRYQWHEMLSVSPKFSVRMQWMGQKLWPNPEAMRERYGSDDPVWKFMFKRIGIGLRRLFG